jgi:hypothetical protein
VSAEWTLYQNDYGSDRPGRLNVLAGRQQMHLLMPRKQA